MTTYEFPSTVAMDPTLNQLVTDGQGYIYALSDPSFTSPLPVVDRFGTAMDGVRTTYNGVTEEFFLDDNPVVWWASGPYAFMIVSFTSLVDAANSASAAATAAQAAAEAATAPADTQVASFLNTSTSQTRAALDPLIAAGGGGGGTPGASSFSELTGTPTAEQSAVGAVLAVVKNGSTWPVRPTSRADVTVLWIGADPSPAIVDSGNGGMLRNLDLRMVTA